MKKSKTFLKSVNWVLAGVLGLLGFAGCSKIGPDAYGTLLLDYTVKGTVVNKADGKPIKGIRVGYSPEFWAVPEYGTLPAPFVPKLKVHVLTDAKGGFTLTDSFVSGEFQIIDNKPVLLLYVEDIDGEENGWFQSEIIPVDFSKAT